jgi:hypothetical protein
MVATVRPAAAALAALVALLAATGAAQDIVIASPTVLAAGSVVVAESLTLLDGGTLTLVGGRITVAGSVSIAAASPLAQALNLDSASLVVGGSVVAAGTMRLANTTLAVASDVGLVGLLRLEGPASLSATNVVIDSSATGGGQYSTGDGQLQARLAARGNLTLVGGGLRSLGFLAVGDTLTLAGSPAAGVNVGDARVGALASATDVAWGCAAAGRACTLDVASSVSAGGSFTLTTPMSAVMVARPTLSHPYCFVAPSASATLRPFFTLRLRVRALLF